MANDNSLRERLYRVVFTNDTRAGQLFDIIVICLIIISIAGELLVSIESIALTHERFFSDVQWVFTILFSIEYLIRLYSAQNRWKYATSFFGIIDLLAVLPSYLSLIIPGTQHLLFLRILRLLRIFRIFQMNHFVREGNVVASALRASQSKIIVFVVFVGVATILMGALMYIVEAEYNSEIQNLPEGIYWAIVTLTTVGYGDTIPVTALGKILASVVMILGYGVIAVPTGIVTAEISSRVLGARDKLKIKCSKCGDEDHLQNSNYCHSCGDSLIP